MDQDNNTPSTTPTEPAADAAPPLQDSKNLALLCWLGSIVLGFIPPV
jgi:hypothetical protein